MKKKERILFVLLIFFLFLIVNVNFVFAVDVDSFDQLPFSECNYDAESVFYERATPVNGLVYPNQSVDTSFKINGDFNQLLFFVQRIDTIHKLIIKRNNAEINSNEIHRKFEYNVYQGWGEFVYYTEVSPFDVITIEARNPNNVDTSEIGAYLYQNTRNPYYNLSDNELSLIYEHDGSYYSSNSAITQDKILLYLKAGISYSFILFDKYTMDLGISSIEADKREVSVKLIRESNNREVFDHTYTEPNPLSEQGVIVGNYTVSEDGIYLFEVEAEDSVFWLYSPKYASPTCRAQPPGQVNGACGLNLNSCSPGNIYDLGSNETHYLWRCLGSGIGGTDSPICYYPLPSSPPPTSTRSFTEAKWIADGSPIRIIDSINVNGNARIHGKVSGFDPGEEILVEIFENGDFDNPNRFVYVVDESDNIMPKGSSSNTGVNLSYILSAQILDIANADLKPYITFRLSYLPDPRVTPILSNNLTLLSSMTALCSGGCYKECDPNIEPNCLREPAKLSFANGYNVLVSALVIILIYIICLRKNKI